MDEHSPQVFISAPPDGDRYPLGEYIGLRGWAYDVEDELLAEPDYRWFVEGEFLGEGSELSIKLPFGLHRLTLAVSDSSGNSGVDQIEIRMGTHMLLPIIMR